MVEDLYKEFKKKVEKKYKIEIDRLVITDQGGDVQIEITPVTKKFTFATKTVEETVEVAEETESESEEE